MTPFYLDARVEEAQGEEELLVHGRVAGDAQLVVAQLVVRALQVCLMPTVTITTELEYITPLGT